MELREYQRKAIDATYQYFATNPVGHPLVVAPTGSGKSVLIAKFVEEVLKQWPNQRILVLAHRKELLQQNTDKIRAVWPEAPVGIYSAGLNSRQLGRAITVAGIASIYSKAQQLGWIDLIIIDEAHLLSTENEGMYNKLIKECSAFNPALRVLGFTATPYRMKTGMLTEGAGAVFTDIAYDIDVAELVSQGFLAPLVSKVSTQQADLSNVHIRGGEFIAHEAEAAMNKESLTSAAIDEMERYLVGRGSWIVFCAGVSHVEKVTEALNARGHDAASITGDTPPMFREMTLRKFKAGEIKCIVNCDVLTTGFDAPNIDALIMLRPTKSTGLYVQMLGRGMRISPGKENCMVLDFAGNVERHGPIDQVKVRKAGGANSVDTAPVKVCPQCRSAVPISARECADCGFVFPEPKRTHHDVVATTKPIMAALAEPETFNVEDVSYTRHAPANKTPSLRVTYTCTVPGGGNLSRKMISEWVCLQHEGYARRKAESWWVGHHVNQTARWQIAIPTIIESALAEVGKLRKPKQIVTQYDGKFYRIIRAIFPSEQEIKDRLEKEAAERAEAESKRFEIDERIFSTHQVDDEIPF